MEDHATSAQAATWRGRRLKLRYRRTAALNLRNLIGKSLALRDGSWVLAT